MLCEVRSLGLSGISGYEVRAECDLSAGLPAFEIVGLPDAAVKAAWKLESKRSQQYINPMCNI